jgi:HSF-type DNA-binding
MGRIVVHDRIKMEASVLPRYFAHSSFASLRRQLNYFSFVRLGKGRQRESTYINDVVVELDDILNLKRRSSGSPPPTAPAATVSAPIVVDVQQSPEVIVSTSQHRPPHQHGEKPMVPAPNVKGSVSRPTTNNKQNIIRSTIDSKQQPVKRARLGSNKKQAVVANPRTASLSRIRIGPLVSEDDHSSSSSSSSSSSTMSAIMSLKQRPSIISLDRTRTVAVDKELLAGCAALLGLSSGKLWE